MGKKLEQSLWEFLRKYSCHKAPLLLALSGGPDSMALFHLLLKQKILFEVAHVDHGWRSCSKDEALALKELCLLHQITFHLKTLEMGYKGGNLEDRCREERLLFFKEIILSRELQAVLMAHHADDQAETVLKRALEGAGIAKLSALLPLMKIGSLTILRPFLDHTKEELLEWLHANKFSYFIDETNKETKFLRGRMREEILPLLSEYFGKNVQKGLCRLAQNALELQEYLDAVINPHLLEKEETITFPLQILQSPFLLKMALKRLFSLHFLSLSNTRLEELMKILQNDQNREIPLTERQKICICNGKVKISKF